MDCIIEVAQERGRRVVRLAGRLAAEQVDELLEVCRGAAAGAQLHLRDLVSVDDVALDVLRQLRDRGYRLTDVTPYMQLRMSALAKAHERNH